MGIAVVARDIIHQVNYVRWLERVETGLPGFRSQWSIRTSGP